MQLRIKYTLDSTVVALDNKVLSESGARWGYTPAISFANFLDCFAESIIIVEDKVNRSNTVEWKGPVVSFCYNFYSGLLALRSRTEEIIYVFGIEQGDFFIKAYREEEMLICEIHGRKLRYPFGTYMRALEVMFKQVIVELPLHYPGLSDNVYFSEIKDMLMRK